MTTRIPGPFRVVAAIAALWIAGFGVYYFLGIALYPSRLTTSLYPLLDWIPDPHAAGDGWARLVPAVNRLKLAEWTLLPAAGLGLIGASAALLRRRLRRT